MWNYLLNIEDFQNLICFLSLQCKWYSTWCLCKLKSYIVHYLTWDAQVWYLEWIQDKSAGKIHVFVAFDAFA